MDKVILKWETEATGDAERDAIGVIPQVLQELIHERKIAVLDYIIARYKSGDGFGLD